MTEKRTVLKSGVRHARTLRSNDSTADNECFVTKDEGLEVHKEESTPFESTLTRGSPEI